MATEYRFTGTAVDGEPRLDDPGRFDAALRKIEGKRFELVLRKPKSKRSLEANAYWWAVPVRILAEHCGYTDTQMHYALLGECFGYTPGPTGDPVPVKPSSSDLTVEEFAQLIDWVLTWAPSELGVVIPSPSEHEGAA